MKQTYKLVQTRQAGRVWGLGSWADEELVIPQVVGSFNISFGHLDADCVRCR